MYASSRDVSSRDEVEESRIYVQDRIWIYTYNIDTYIYTSSRDETSRGEVFCPRDGLGFRRDETVSGCMCTTESLATRRLVYSPLLSSRDEVYMYRSIARQNRVVCARQNTLYTRWFRVVYVYIYTYIYTYIETRWFRVVCARQNTLSV